MKSSVLNVPETRFIRHPTVLRGSIFLASHSLYPRPVLEFSLCIKRRLSRKEDVKLSLFARDMIYIENPEHSTKKKKKTIKTDKFSEVEDYKADTQKSVVFLYINDDLSEREIEKAVPFTRSIKKKKICRSKFNQKGERYVL